MQFVYIWLLTHYFSLFCWKQLLIEKTKSVKSLEISWLNLKLEALSDCGCLKPFFAPRTFQLFTITPTYWVCLTFLCIFCLNNAFRLIILDYGFFLLDKWTTISHCGGWCCGSLCFNKSKRSGSSSKCFDHWEGKAFI